MTRQLFIIIENNNIEHPPEWSSALAHSPGEHVAGVDDVRASHLEAGPLEVVHHKLVTTKGTSGG
jgi:hypothetical protein